VAEVQVIYKFKSRAAGDIIMMGPNGDALLRLLGREPAAKGIIEPAACAPAIAAIEQALLADDAARAEAQGVGLRQRLWPMVEMLKRAAAADEPVVWGV
jgi:hypothetical protein